MKISSINSNINSLQSHNIIVRFKGDKKSDSKVIIDDDGKEYVKVPKWSHDLENWVFGVLTVITILQFINSLINKKSEPWESAYKELR